MIDFDCQIITQPIYVTRVIYFLNREVAQVHSAQRFDVFIHETST